MLTYEYELSNSIFLEKIVPANVHQHITEIIEASTLSRFHCKIEEKTPNIYICILEENDIEPYTIGHLFSCDLIGKDYTYHSLSLEQIQFATAFINRVSSSTS